jgi:TetR/AcrR family transcriptional repressor of nem operon
MSRTATREELIKAGAEIIAQQGFNSTGLNAVLSSAGVPKGSFYYYFPSKEDFGLAVIDEFGESYNNRMRSYLQNKNVAPLKRIRNYMEDGIKSMETCACKRGCLIGSLGQELAGQNEVFRKRLADIFQEWSDYFTDCLEEAKAAGEIAKDSNTKELADLILNGWQGASLRAKVTKSVKPMKSYVKMLFTKILV